LLAAKPAPRLATELGEAVETPEATILVGTEDCPPLPVKSHDISAD